MEINTSETQKKQNNIRGSHPDDNQHCFIIFPPGACNKYIDNMSSRSML